jgi:hypothetical protein
VDWSAPVDEVPAYPGGWVSDGFGLSATPYVWSTIGLASGVWLFAVVPFDTAGNNRGTGQTVSLTASAAPLPPGPDAGGRRLTYTYSGPGTRQVTLNWLASPSVSPGP